MKKNNMFKSLLASCLVFSLGTAYAVDSNSNSNSNEIEKSTSDIEKEKPSKEDVKKEVGSKDEAIKYYNSDKQNYREAAFKYFLNNAGREISSLYYLGLITYNGEFTIAKDENLGIRMIEGPAKAGYRDAVLFIAKRKVESDNAEEKNKGLQLLLDPKYESDADILFYLGQIYDEGKYVPQNNYYAERYYTMAANAGNDAASYKIGAIYIKSDNQDKKTDGWTMLARAANNKNPDACHIMSLKFKDKAISQNQGVNTYLGYLRCSANGGNANDAKEYAYYLVTGKFVKYNNKEAYRYFQIYLTNNKEEVTSDTYFQIGVLSVETGNKVSAEDNLKKASENGVSDASYYIAKLFENGYWTGESDFIRAKQYYERAGEQGKSNIEIDLKRIEDKINLITPSK